VASAGENNLAEWYRGQFTAVVTDQLFAGLSL